MTGDREQIVRLAAAIGHALYALDRFNERVVTGESALRCYPIPIWSHWRLEAATNESDGELYMAFTDAFIDGYTYHAKDDER